MKEQTEHILTAILAALLLPCALTWLLGGRMERIYRAIKNETEYISIKTDSGTLELDIEEYVIGITAAQIPQEYDPEAIKAQMVAARTNLYRQISENGQVQEEAYVTMEELERTGMAEKFLRAEKATRDQILTWEDTPILASFHAVSAGQTRDAAEVLQSEKYPYLVSKACPADENAPDAKSEVQIDDSWRGMTIENRDSAGYVLQVELNGEVYSGEKFRVLLGLASAHFEVDVREDGVFLSVSGVGHGLGMSQYTAQQLALSGKDYKEILGYFFPGVTLKKA